MNSNGPSFEDWGVSVFYDAGNAFDSFTEIHLSQGAGVGLHYYTPVGALNLSLARQVGVEDPGFRIHSQRGVRTVKGAIKYSLIALLAAAIIGAGGLGAAWLAGTTDGRPLVRGCGFPPYLAHDLRPARSKGGSSTVCAWEGFA